MRTEYQKTRKKILKKIRNGVILTQFIRRIQQFSLVGNKGQSNRLDRTLEAEVNFLKTTGLIRLFENSFRIFLKGSPDPRHLIFEINVGKRRIRHITTLNLNLQPILVDLKIHHSISSFNFTLISKIKWLGPELPLKI